MDNSTGNLPPAATHQKRIVGRTKPGRRSQKHIIRATAKQLADSNNPNLCHDLNLPCVHGHNNIPCKNRRQHLEEDLNKHRWWQSSGSNCSADRQGHPRARSRWHSIEDEGQDLARSGVPLPSDRFHMARQPSLEREEAFRDANTAKSNVCLRRTVTPSSEDAQVAELYRMGLLYDDEKDRGSGFDLNSISHEQPVYSVRPAKQTRKSKRKNHALEQQLYLDLSFTDLGGDDVLANYLASPPLSDDGTSQSQSEQPGRFSAPLRVIYDVDGSGPALDMDTSQPPDLVSDLLSDYDCFSDSDLDDLPLQREVRDGAATPTSDAWVVLGDDS